VELRKKCVVGFVGGSDLSKQLEQLGPNGNSSSVLKALHKPDGDLSLWQFAVILFAGRRCERRKACCRSPASF